MSSLLEEVVEMNEALQAKLSYENGLKGIGAKLTNNEYAVEIPAIPDARQDPEYVVCEKDQGVMMLYCSLISKNDQWVKATGNSHKIAIQYLEVRVDRAIEENQKNINPQPSAGGKSPIWQRYRQYLISAAIAVGVLAVSGVGVYRIYSYFKQQSFQPISGPTKPQPQPASKKAGSNPPTTIIENLGIRDETPKPEPENSTPPSPPIQERKALNISGSCDSTKIYQNKIPCTITVNHGDGPVSCNYTNLIFSNNNWINGVPDEEVKQESFNNFRAGIHPAARRQKQMFSCRNGVGGIAYSEFEFEYKPPRPRRTTSSPPSAADAGVAKGGDEGAKKPPVPPERGPEKQPVPQEKDSEKPSGLSDEL